MFTLNELQKKAISSASPLNPANQYDLHGLNIMRINPDGLLTSGDSQIIFTIDSSKLSGNIMINRIECEVDYKVVATGDYSSAAVTYASGLYPNTLGSQLPYLMSPANGALDSFVVNKSFSTIELSDKQTQLVQDTRTPEKIEILSRLLSDECKQDAGIYEEVAYGVYTDKAGGATELTSVADFSTVQSMYARGSSPHDIQQNVFWKRNTNKQYIEKKSNTFKNSAGAVIPSVAPVSTSPWFKFNDGDGKYWFDLVGGSAAYPSGKQETTFTVREDLLHDILCTKYQDVQNYCGIPTTDLVLTFTKSSILNSLYKTSNENITNISVEITGMRLNVFSFNFGLLNIPVRPTYFGFFTETAQQQVITLSTTDEKIGQVMQQRQYNSVPQYVAIYCQEPTQSSGVNLNIQRSLTPAKVKRVVLQIDNEVDGPLYNMSIRELKQRTLKNLYDSKENVEALFRDVTLPAKGRLSNKSAFNLAVSWTTANSLATYSGASEGRSFLDGYFLLRLGEDIRLPADMCVGQDRKVTLTFTIDFEKISNPLTGGTGDVQCVFNQIAYFPSYYKMSAEKGLLKAEKFVITEKEFSAMLERTRGALRSSRPENVLAFSSQYPLMVGSGFGNIWDFAKRSFPVARRVAHSIAKITRDVANEFDSELARDISEKASKAEILLRKPKKVKKEKTVGRPRLSRKN